MTRATLWVTGCVWPAGLSVRGVQGGRAESRWPPPSGPLATARALKAAVKGEVAPCRPWGRGQRPAPCTVPCPRRLTSPAQLPSPRLAATPPGLPSSPQGDPCLSAGWAAGLAGLGLDPNKEGRAGPRPGFRPHRARPAVLGASHGWALGCSRGGPRPPRAGGLLSL